MTCAEVADRIIDRLYGELPESDRRAFELHLTSCEGCRRELDGLEQTRRTARTALAGLPFPARPRPHPQRGPAGGRAGRAPAGDATDGAAESASDSRTGGERRLLGLAAAALVPARLRRGLPAGALLPGPAGADGQLQTGARRVALAPAPRGQGTDRLALEDEPTVPIARPEVCTRRCHPEWYPEWRPKSPRRRRRRSASRPSAGPPSEGQGVHEPSSERWPSRIPRATARSSRPRPSVSWTGKKPGVTRGSAAAPRSVSRLFVAAAASRTDGIPIAEPAAGAPLEPGRSDPAHGRRPGKVTVRTDAASHPAAPTPGVRLGRRSRPSHSIHPRPRSRRPRAPLRRTHRSNVTPTSPRSPGSRRRPPIRHRFRLPPLGPGPTRRCPSRPSWRRPIACTPSADGNPPSMPTASCSAASQPTPAPPTGAADPRPPPSP